jgi:hypothetical protein
MPREEKFLLVWGEGERGGVAVTQAVNVTQRD